ncbi:putative sensor domain DACNV-containing protein [Desulfosarcina sp.]|uniref:putative sensor domain DACNV-containing protein n=1 Tax=Desulfosarcina sp. TaxID=2027861 RepID=UPI003970552C
MYFASIEYEEGVQVKVRVVLYPDTTLKTLFYHAPWIDAFPFGEELLFSTETLTKLAPAFNQDSTAIAVARISQIGQLRLALSVFNRLSSLSLMSKTQISSSCLMSVISS